VVFSKLCQGPSASGDKGISLTPQKSARGKFHQIGNEKRASVDWSGHLPVVGNPKVILKRGLRNSVTRPNLGTIRGR